MDWITGMQAAIDYIEEHLTDALDYTDIAAQAYSSPYHFQRMFSILSGCTLGEYIRYRRMTRAGMILQTTAARVVDTALESGYSSPDSFAKAFQKFHGVTPTEARRKGVMLRSFSRLTANTLPVADRYMKGGYIMQYRIEKLPEMILTGFTEHFEGAPENRNGQMATFYIHTRPKQYMLDGMAEDPFTHYEIIRNVTPEGYDCTIAQRLTGYVRTHMADPTVLGPEFAGWYEHITIPTHLYVIAQTERCKFPTNVYLELRQKLVTEWLPDSGYLLADAPEISVCHWYKTDKSSRYTELWIPVEKKQ